MKITFPVPAPGATVVQVVGGTTFEISMRGAAPNLELFARIGATAPSRLVAQQSTADGFLQMLLGPSDSGVSFPARSRGRLLPGRTSTASPIKRSSSPSTRRCSWLS